MLIKHMAEAGVCLAVLAVALTAASPVCYGQNPKMENVVYLKDGSVIRGTISEWAGDKSLTIETRGGSTLTINLDEIDRVSREPAGRVTKYADNMGKQIGRKNGGLAFFYSLLLIGGGQFYNGETEKALTLLAMNFVGFALVFAEAESNRMDVGAAGILGSVLILGSFLCSVIDAPISSARINRRFEMNSFYGISDNLHIDICMKRIDSKLTPCLRAVLEF